MTAVFCDVWMREEIFFPSEQIPAGILNARFGGLSKGEGQF